MTEPLAGEFRTVHDEVNYGVSLQQALTNLSERVPLTDLRYFVVAVLIQRDSGGNLTEVLGEPEPADPRSPEADARVKVLSSEGRLSAWILALMPFALAGLMNLVNPEFMSPLWTDPIGIEIVKYMLDPHGDRHPDPETNHQDPHLAGRRTSNERRSCSFFLYSSSWPSRSRWRD